MKWNHPKLGRAAAIGAIMALAGVGGCRSGSSTGLTNPFLAPERVPPPGTRALAPGTAKPYYPGDPLPAMQSATNGSWAPVATAPSDIAERFAMRDEAAPPKSVAFANEPSVAIPGDGDSLRFPLPKPPDPEPPSPTTPPTARFAAAPAAGRTSAGTVNAQVVPASFTQDAAPLTAGSANTSSWRSPQIPSVAGDPWRGSGPGIRPNASLIGALPPPPTTAPSTVGIASPDNMNVRLRAVPSPPPEPGEASAPRIRLPGYGYPQATAGPPIAVEQAAYLAAQPSTSYGNRDGFRPRSSMR